MAWNICTLILPPDSFSTGLRREELVQTQGDLLRHRAACKECCAHQTDGAELELFHGEVSLKI